MKLSCDTAKLKIALTNALGAVDKRSPRPITQNVKITAEGSSLKVTGSNGSLSIETTIPARVESPGETTIVAQFFSDFIGSLSEESIAIDTETEAKKNMALISYRRSEARISTNSADQFPIAPETQSREITISGLELRAAIDKVGFSASKDEVRLVLTAVQMVVNKENLKFTSADGYRMSIYTAPREPDPAGSDNDEDENYVMIPAITLRATRKLFRDAPTEVTIGLDEDKKHISFTEGGRRITSSLMNEKPPLYESLVPESHSTSASIPVTEMLSAAITISTLRDNQQPTVKFELLTKTDDENPDSLVMFASVAERGDNFAGLNAAVEGDDNKVAFNNGYILDMLKAMKPNSALSLTMTDSQTPVMFTEKPKEGQGSFRHIIMPMMID